MDVAMPLCAAESCPGNGSAAVGQRVADAAIWPSYYGVALFHDANYEPRHYMHSAYRPARAAVGAAPIKKSAWATDALRRLLMITDFQLQLQQVYVKRCRQCEPG